MKKKYISIGILIIFLLIVLVFKAVERKSQCGDGLCQELEMEKGSCPADCGEKDYPIPPNNAPWHWWDHFDLPPTTVKERQAYCDMTEAEKEQYYQEQNEKARQLSERLENYIRSWYYGDADAKLPDGLLPPSIDNEKNKDWTLLRPEEVNPEDQWMLIPAREIPDDFSALYGNSIDTHATFSKLVFVAPLDSQLLIEGDFPHSRFMDYQITAPFNPKLPAGGNLGPMEVPIVDVDIKPDPGHTNPFLTGANRNATKRHYHLIFDLKAGNSMDLNPEVMKTHAFRGPGNKRVGGPFGSSGPYFNGSIGPAVLWFRYYAPDKAVGPLGGVSLPKALLRLSTGETFWLQPDSSLAIRRWAATPPGAYTPPEEPWRSFGPKLGWFKIFDLYLLRAELYGYSWSHWTPDWIQGMVKKRIRADIECYLSRGPQMPPPGNYEPSATACTYNSYLSRLLQLGPQKVNTITGRLPTTPKTRNGETTMEKAQARYWSICHEGSGEDKKYHNLVYGCLMDDEITVNDQNDYIIVYSRPEDRPANARPECGVTWQEFGPESRQGSTIRWMSVAPDHFMEEYSPHIHNIPWQTGAWSQDNYDKTLVGENKPGVMGPYHPVIHYLTKEEFEALDCPVDSKNIPQWQ